MFLSSSVFHKPLSYNNLGQIAGAHISHIVTTDFKQSAAAFVEELSLITRLKITCGRSKNVARELTAHKKIKDRNGYNAAILIQPGSMRIVSS
ncbi:hypothetical protein TNCV_2134451 [Trichonephila clavipes]|nr:hypothetical protein TNCV_2134451 [Trichonephila clavipes]